MALSNPASSHCVQVGGTLKIQKRGDGAEYGVCYLMDNRQCDEWALFNGQCPLEGMKVTGYTTPAQVYCAIQGAKILIVSNDSDSDCLFSDGSLCTVQAFFDGKCWQGKTTR